MLRGRIAGHAEQDVAVLAARRDAGKQDRVVATVFPHPPQATVDEPDHGMEPPRRTQQHLRPGQPCVSTAEVSQFVNQDGIQFARRKILGGLRQHNGRPPGAGRQRAGNVG